MERYFVVLDMVNEWYGPDGRMAQDPIHLTVIMIDELRAQFGIHDPARIIELWKKDRGIDGSEQTPVGTTSYPARRDV